MLYLFFRESKEEETEECTNKMELEEKRKFLTVGPFECAWGEEFQFKETGRGCISFEASAQNDVTLVFREHIGSQHYHYKRDNHPNYTIILGSHRNRRLKIEVDGMSNLLIVCSFVVCVGLVKIKKEKILLDQSCCNETGFVFFFYR
jgi:Farnesoic acid 0-methyl transferase